MPDVALGSAKDWCVPLQSECFFEFTLNARSFFAARRRPVRCALRVHRSAEALVRVLPHDGRLRLAHLLDREPLQLLPFKVLQQQKQMSADVDR